MVILEVERFLCKVGVAERQLTLDQADWLFF